MASACCSWYPNLSMSLKTKLQRTHKSCIRYCLGLKDKSHNKTNEFDNTNWLAVLNRVEQCLAGTTNSFVIYIHNYTCHLVTFCLLQSVTIKIV